MRSSTLVILIAVLVWSSSFDSCHAIRWHPWYWRPWYWRPWWMLPSMRHHHGGFGRLNHTAPPPQLSPSQPPPLLLPPSLPLPPHNDHLPPPLLPPPPKKSHAPPPLPPPSSKPPPPPANPGHETRKFPTFNVLNFGARGDGKTDDTMAFHSTWTAACQMEASTVLVPEGHEFLVGTISFEGRHCRKNIIFQLDGTIIAPMNRENWGRDLSNWIVFKRVTGLTVQGEGTIEGSGSGWWHVSGSDDLEDIEDVGKQHVDLSDKDEDEDYGDEDNRTEQREGRETVVTAKVLRGVKPTALRIYRSNNATLAGIKIQNSPNVHVKIMNCNGVKVHDLSVSSPGDSPNTDGIQVHRSRDVVIHSSNLACGDDCIAIQKGCHNLTVYNVTCGPGHGISIGSLGPDHSKACVSNIMVRDIDMHDTTNGARIKTWQGGMGSVQGVTFSDIRMSRVRYPIIIDQYYCDKGKDCGNQTSAVAVSGITYENIRGTYTDMSILFACSDSVPCTDITLNGVDLQPVQQNGHGHHHHHIHEPLCWQVFGEWTPTKAAQINCSLQAGKPSGYNRVLLNLNLC
ncbi:hypothetical protein CRG98_032078 [Punica granatum]|uniref:Polygalacturonase At1g48100 n=1 Tax=Punica granatum TaxID=22663 RepID=A0A2I0IU05_PUNGR|nr:hypothetical protein CRG98_032078 [Punica granatum]